MKAYRVDRKNFDVADPVYPTGEYFDELDSKGEIVENCLEENRPSNKPKRNKVLHIFQKLEDAQKFWSKMKTGKLSIVEIDDKELLHQGDMEITENMYKNSDDAHILKQLAEKYWSGKNTSNPEIEILVESAIVTEIFSKDETERKQEFIKRSGLPDLGK